MNWHIKTYLLLLFSHFFLGNLYAQQQPINNLYLELWLRSDSVALSATLDTVVTLFDKSGNNRNATQIDKTKQPKYKSVETNINDKPSIIFDGVNDLLIGSGNLGQLTNYSFFLVVRNNVNKNYNWFYKNAPLSISKSFSLTSLSSGDYRFWSNGGGGFSDFIAPSPINSYHILSVINKNDSAVVSSYFKNGFFTSSANNVTSTHNENGFVLGCISEGNHHFNGEFVELIIYNKVLNENERYFVENYLRYRYFPDLYQVPVDLGPDIYVNYGFCDTSITAPAGYNSYLWNTGETTQQIVNINQGTYWVEVTDAFNHKTRDTIQVLYPTFEFPEKQLICAYDSMLWNLNLGVDYQYLWNDGRTTEQIYISQNNDYWVTITDSLGCSVVSDVISFFIDSFPNTNLFPSDTNFCSGNFLTTDSNYNSYLWSTSQTTSSIIINNSDNYSVTVTNENGCQAMDTIFVHVVGEAPTPLFSADTVCLGLPTTFTDLSFSNDLSNINYWHWDFGDGSSDVTQHPQHIYNQFGVFDVTLTLETDSGCGSIYNKSIQVVNYPDLIVSNDISCVNNTIQFTDDFSFYESDTLKSISWLINGISFSESNSPSYYFEDIGLYNIVITYQTKFNCIDTTYYPLKILNLNIPKLYYPKNNYLTSDSCFILKWEISQCGAKNDIIVSSNSGFIDTLLYLNNYAFDSLIFYASSPKKYFWKVRFNDGVNISDWSETRIFEVLDPKSIDNLELWLRSDSVALSATLDTVVTLFDKSGNNRNATQIDKTKQPKYKSVETNINDKPSIIFDGVNDLLIGSGNLGQLTNYSFFLVVRNNVNKNYNWFYKNAPLSTSKSFSLTSMTSGDYRFWSNGGGGFSDFTAPSPINSYHILSVINKNDSSVVSSYFKNGFFTSSANNVTSTHAENGFVLGCISEGNHHFNGEFVELIIYNKVLNENERYFVENYLRYRYFPDLYQVPVDLGPDIYVNYGFCDTSITAPAGYNSYLWNTGETTQQIVNINQGTYWVEVTDAFNHKTRDTIQVIYPPFELPEKQLICAYDSMLWNLNLGVDYQYLWNDGRTTEQIYISQNNDYWATITDSLGCSVVSDVISFFIDSFPNTNLFPSDTNFCSGNILTANSNYNSYLWSTSQTTSSIIINNSDNYSVTVTNENGCQAIDTIFVHVVGEAPTPLFSADTVCLGFPTTFTDQSFSTDLSNINYWHWDFGDGSSDVTQHPQHLYDNFGVFDVTLTLETDSGCGNKIIKKVLVNRIPEFDFNISYSQPCTGENYPINFLGVDHLNTISEWQWTFEDVNAANFDDNSGSDVAHVYQNAGTYFSRLVVWDDNGCTDTTFKKLVIYPTPQPDFVYTPDCEGKTSAFTDNTPNAATNWNWQWNATGISGNIGSTPMFSYNFLNGGGYNVTMTVQTPQQCVAQTVKNIFIPKRPNVQYSITDFCINTPIQVFDESTVLNSYPVKWHWNVLNHPNESSEQHPIFTFSEQKNLDKYSMRLVVESVEGCKDSITKTITIREEPTADFTFNPKFGQPPLAVNFSNQSSEDVIAYHWSFGDNQFSELENPVHLYIDSAVYDIQLKVNNEFGCADSTAKFIKVLLPTLDLAIANAKSSLVNDRYLTITANIINLGTRAVFDFNLFLVSSDNVVIREVWEGELLTNQVIPYQFTASFDTEQQTTPKYICVKVDHPNGEQDENMSNNEYCLTFSDFTVFDPYPNPTFETLNLLIIIPKNSNIEIKLLNQIGQEVRNLYSGQLNKGIQKFDYDISTLRNGIYTLKFSNGEEVILKTFIKQ
jgi:PKD repeat protein